MNNQEHKLTSIKDIISNLLNDPGLPFNPDDARIWEVWDDVVGGAIARNARPSWIKNRRLRVVVTEPIWLQELEFVGERIKEKLNARLERKAVEKIEFRLRASS